MMIVKSLKGWRGASHTRRFVYAEIRILSPTRGGSYTVNKLVYYAPIIGLYFGCFGLFWVARSIRKRSKEETRIQ